jgi:heat shock protein HslJ
MPRAARIGAALSVRPRTHPRCRPYDRIEEVPVLDIGRNGAAEIELWCNSVKAQLVVAANTITIITGAMSSRQCPPDRARADDELLTALNRATNWQMEDCALVFTGGKTLRFRMQTN